MPLTLAETIQLQQESLVRNLIEYIDPEPDRPGLKDTPRRVVESWKELFAGYSMKPDEILKEFDGEGYDEMILVKNISFYSTCEHHMLPFFGVAHVAYIPYPSDNHRVFGLSKLARLVDCFSRRLTVQERITKEVTLALCTKSLGAACVLEATHGCMACRGVRQTDATTITSFLRGPFLVKPEARAELFSLINGK